jgi:hypothetical protein
MSSLLPFDHPFLQAGHVPAARRQERQGIDPAGKPLAWPMPRWSMREDDLNDLVTFLKTLK